MNALVWVAAALVLGVVEMLTVDFFFLMLAIASLGAALTAWLGFGFGAQVATFTIISVILLLTVRPWIKRLLGVTSKEKETNISALIGQHGLVVRQTGPSSGLVKLNGEDWSARTADGTTVPAGEKVEIVEISGVSLVVIPVV